MPNIEIVGAIPGGSDEQIIFKIIKTHLSNKELQDFVFKIDPTPVKDVNGYDAPYVRIYGTDEKMVEKIAGLLHNIIDVETIILTKFIPKNKENCLDTTRPL